MLHSKIDDLKNEYVQTADCLTVVKWVERKTIKFQFNEFKILSFIPL